MGGLVEVEVEGSGFLCSCCCCVSSALAPYLGMMDVPEGGFGYRLFCDDKTTGIFPGMF